MARLNAYLLAKPLKTLRRILVFVVGSSVLLVGVVMLVTPGPAFVVIPAGLGILAIEFAWARRLLKKAKAYIANAARQATGRKEEVSSDQ